MSLQRLSVSVSAHMHTLTRMQFMHAMCPTTEQCHASLLFSCRTECLDTCAGSSNLRRSRGVADKEGSCVKAPWPPLNQGGAWQCEHARPSAERAGCSACACISIMWPPLKTPGRRWQPRLCQLTSRAGVRLLEQQPQLPCHSLRRSIYRRGVI